MFCTSKLPGYYSMYPWLQNSWIKSKNRPLLFVCIQNSLIPSSLWPFYFDNLISLSVSSGTAVGGGTRMSSCGLKTHIDKLWTNPYAYSHRTPPPNHTLLPPRGCCLIVAPRTHAHTLVSLQIADIACHPGIDVWSKRTWMMFPTVCFTEAAWVTQTQWCDVTRNLVIIQIGCCA